MCWNGIGHKASCNARKQPVQLTCLSCKTSTTGRPATRIANGFCCTAMLTTEREHGPAIQEKIETQAQRGRERERERELFTAQVHTFAWLMAASYLCTMWDGQRGRLFSSGNDTVPMSRFTTTGCAVPVSLTPPSASRCMDECSPASSGVGDWIHSKC